MEEATLPSLISLEIWYGGNAGDRRKSIPARPGMQGDTALYGDGDRAGGDGLRIGGRGPQRPLLRPRYDGLLRGSAAGGAPGGDTGAGRWRRADLAGRGRRSRRAHGSLSRGRR